MLLDKQRPLVLHNGWIDLVFLYHHLFAALPPTLDSFLACLADIMPCVVDTKYLAEFAARENASFLEYLYRKMQRRQMRLPDDSSLQLLPAPGENALSLAAHAVQAVTKLDLTPCRSDSNDKVQRAMAHDMLVARASNSSLLSPSHPQRKSAGSMPTMAFALRVTPAPIRTTWKMFWTRRRAKAVKGGASRSTIRRQQKSRARQAHWIRIGLPPRRATARALTLT